MTNTAQNPNFSRNWLTFTYTTNRIELECVSDIYSDFCWKQASNVSKFDFCVCQCSIAHAFKISNVTFLDCNAFFYHGGTSPTKFLGWLGRYISYGLASNTVVELVEMVDATSELAPITRVKMFYDNKSHPPKISHSRLSFLFWDEFVILGWICHTVELSFSA